MNLAVSITPPPEDLMGNRRESEGFAALDRDVVASNPGALVIRTRDDDLTPILAHAARRLRAAGGRVVEAFVRPPASLFREAATQLGLGPLKCDVRTFAKALPTATQNRVAIVAPMPKEGSWDEIVARELAELGEVVLVLATSGLPPSWATRTVDVTAELSLDEKRRWLEAATRDDETLLRGRDLRDLEVWWRQSRRADVAWHVGSTALRWPLPVSALEIAVVIALARRSIPLNALQVSPADAEHIAALVDAGVIVESGGALVLDVSVDRAAFESLASLELRERTARLLLGDGDAFALDPWACARAAELLVEERPLEADAAMERAARVARDARITTELAARWREIVEGIPGDMGNELRVRAAERALDLGKPHDAIRWCEGLIDETRRGRIELATARAHIQLGDLVSARFVLERLQERETNDELSATIAVERGELEYLAGDLAMAESEAEAALRITRLPRTRLAARSILGKLLLARGEWDAADSHFAADAITAQTAGEATADLRARLNRGIALGSKGFLDEARQILLRVLEDAGRAGEHRATAHALANLGFIAYRQRNFMGALRYWEERLHHGDSLGGRTAGALPIASLAETRLMLGLVDDAEHAVRFGRKITGGSLTPARAAHFERIAAAIALARGTTDVARREVQQSMIHARASGEVESVGAGAVIGARVALAEGDLRQVDEWLRLAEENARTPETSADIAFLRAAQLRALGQPALEAAQRALELAREVEDYDLSVELHTLVAMAARDEGDLDKARAHGARAVEIRDRIAASLSPDVRAAFSAKPEMGTLAKLVASLADVDGDAEQNTADPPPRALRRPSRRGDAGERTWLIGSHPRMKSLEVAIRKSALSDSTILICGESGTGKELVARALHSASLRASGPLVIVNCAALVETLLLSELFGHEKGAFTGASARRRGRFELAEGGTLFLDEIGDISPRTQVALLRVLQERTFERIGGTVTLRSNVRVICATNRDLYTMVGRGEFREDLYYRLRGITLEVPPLRARATDVSLLAHHLLERIAKEDGGDPKRLTTGALARLEAHSWPGNVRELENVLHAATVFVEGQSIDAADLTELDDGRIPTKRASTSSATLGSDDERRRPSQAEPRDPSPSVAAYSHVRAHGVSLHDLKRQIERECVTRALADSGGNITRAAELLGMKRPRVSQLVKQYGLLHSGTEEEEQ